MNLSTVTQFVGISLLICIPVAVLRGGEIATFVEPYRDIDVAGSEMGSLAYLNVREGDRVSAGQVLAGLDESVLEAALSTARAAKESTGRLASAEAEMQLQRDRLEKIKQLFTRKHASAEELSRAQTQFDIAASQVRAVREELAVKAAEYARIEAQLTQKKIISPIDGVVTKVFKDVGEFVSASDPVVAKIVQLDQLLAEFSVPQRTAVRFKRGQKLSLTVGRTRETVQGVVEFVSPVTDAQSNTTRIRIRIDNGEGRLHSGDSCWLPVNGPGDPLAGGRFVGTKQREKSSKRRSAD